MTLAPWSGRSNDAFSAVDGMPVRGSMRDRRLVAALAQGDECWRPRAWPPKVGAMEAATAVTPHGRAAHLTGGREAAWHDEQRPAWRRIHGRAAALRVFKVAEPQRCQ